MKQIDTTNNTRTYVIVNHQDKSVFETTDYEYFYEIVHKTHLLKVLPLFWVAERIDDYNVSVYHEYHKIGSHSAVVVDIGCIQPNEQNIQNLLNDIHYYSNRKEHKKELLKDLKKRKKEADNDEFFDKKIDDIKKIYKKDKNANYYEHSQTGAIVKKISKKVKNDYIYSSAIYCFDAVVVKHENCPEDVGSINTYSVDEVKKIKH